MGGSQLNDLARRVLESAPIIILVLDAVGRIRHMNPHFENLSGFRLDEVRGEDWFDTFIPERDRVSVRALFGQSRAGAHVRGSVNAIVTRAGQERLIEWTDEELHGDEDGPSILALGQDVTERLATEHRMRSVVLAIEDGIVVHSVSGEIVESNPAAERWLDSARAYEPALVALRTGAPVSNVVDVAGADGRQTRLSINARPLLDPSGVVGVVTSLSDVTDRLQGEERLRASEAMLREAQRLAKLGSWELDLVTGALSWSDEIFRIFEIDPERFGASYETFLETIHPDDRGAVDGAYRASVADRSSYEIVHRLRMPDGRIKWVQERGQTHYDDAGNPLRSVGTVQDITERRREQERLEQTQALAHVGSWELDFVTNQVWWSNETFRILGIDPRERPASFEAYLDAVHPDERALVEETFRRSLEDRASYDQEHRILCPGGQVKHVRAQVRSTFDADGTPRRSEGTLQDITEQVQSKLRLRDILDGMFSFVGLFDLGGNLVEVNRAPLEAGGVTREEVLGKPFWEQYWWSYSQEAQDRIRATIARAATGEVVRDDFFVRLRGERFATFDATFGPLLDAEGRIEGVVGSGVDISERKSAEEVARRSSELLSTVVAGAPVILFALDERGDIKLAEGRGLAALGLGAGEVVGASAFGLHGEVLGFREQFGRVISGEVAMATQTGTVGALTLEALLMPSRDAKGEIDGVIGVALDVTTRVAAEAASRDRERRLAAIFDATADNMVLVAASPDRWLEIVAVNRPYVEASQKAGYLKPGMEVEGRSYLDLLRKIGLPDESIEFVDRASRRVLEERAPAMFERSHQGIRGLSVTEVTASPIFDEAGAALYVLWIYRDITARKETERLMEASLAEKETLLREIHHRVKNNLQVIAGLVHFQGKKLHAPEDVVMLDELRQRIFAMTLVHERLYQAEDLARVDFGGYVRELVTELGRSFKPRSDVRLDVVADLVRLPIELALPSGMIVCELVTNVMKYAFPEPRGGTATVAIRMDGDRVTIAVDDDGVGLPEGVGAGAGGAFGWQLVRTLVLQLDGTLDATSERGTHVNVSFHVPTDSAS